MRVRIHKTVTTNDGKVKSDEVKEYREETEATWQKLGYKLRRNAKGHEVKWRAYADTRGKERAIMYTEDEVLPMTPRELERYKKKQKEARHQQYEARKAEKKAQEERERRAEEARLQTAWQWLSRERRVPVDGAQAVPKRYTSLEYIDWDMPDIRDESETRTWYYYAKKDTRKVTDEEYQKLHDSYVEQFGGWSEIDLAHTTYDGHKWW